MISLIAAVCNNLGIGKLGRIPWHIRGDMEFFRSTTFGSVVIMGSATYMSIPESKRPLSNRMNVVITRNPDAFWARQPNTDVLKAQSDLLVCRLEDVETNVLQKYSHLMRIFVIGGEYLYQHFLPQAHKVFLTHVHKQYDCDRFFPGLPSSFQLKRVGIPRFDEQEQVTYQHLVYERANNGTPCQERVYLNMAQDIIEHGNERQDRTSTGTISVFGRQMRFDISKSVPLLTTKRLPWKQCVEELLWFLCGDTNAKHLQDKGIKIWDGNSTRAFLDKVGLTHLEEGDVGANYSFQWRHFGAEYKDCHTDYSGKGVDQIEYVLHLLRTDPMSRRIFLSAWNPADLLKTALPPCHVSAQFYVELDNHGKKHLSCHMYQRSCDFFLGEPWNMLSYTVLTYILAKKADMVPKELIISTGDTHIYMNHVEQIQEQLHREPRPWPVLMLKDEVRTKDWSQLSVDDFMLSGYFPHPSIKGAMAV
jgi:dihydrofolate reductase/thymidylate synthase